jgi:hypothetical protein
MALNQQKLSKSEWDSIEISVSDEEKKILNLIIRGFTDVNIHSNDTNSLFTFLKLEHSLSLEEFLYNKHFADKVKALIATYKLTYIKLCKPLKSDFTTLEDDLSAAAVASAIALDENGNRICNIRVGHIVKLKSSDQIRMNRSDLINESVTEIYEFILIKHLEQMLQLKSKGNLDWQLNYFTLSKLMLNNIEKLNRFIVLICNTVLENVERFVNLLDIVRGSYNYIERNSSLLKYGDLSLYEHQKQIFVTMKQEHPKLVLYIAPTGTGKTLTPLGLSETKKVIFVCAARHVGIALARASISINKRIAFAFGCNSANDIRLHYFAAKEYTRDKRSGRIRKVDNTIGDKVEIIICDIRSYLPAMYYMIAFNKPEDIITYWDEPTITMDYINHDLHSIIKENWTKNLIPNVVLSSATLPKVYELDQTIADFSAKFADFKYIKINDDLSADITVKQPQICSIVSHDCRKTIPLINNNGYVVMPHYITEDYGELMSIIENCEENMTLLRYFDLKEAAAFIIYVEEHNLVKSSAKCNRVFASVHDIDMQSVKLQYLKALKHVNPDDWSNIHLHFIQTREIKVHANNTVDTKGAKLKQTVSVDSVKDKSLKGPKGGSELTRLSSYQQPITPSITAAPAVVQGICGIYFTTKDAYTLTDGPTIFLAKEVTKIAQFCVQQSNIPASVMSEIQDKIEFNNKVNNKIASLEADLENIQEKLANSGSSNDYSKDKKEGKRSEKGSSIDKSKDNEVISIIEDLAILKQMIKTATLNDMFIPNKKAHKAKWAETLPTATAFTSDIDDIDIISIMMLTNVDDSWKVLLLLGIGVFTEHRSSEYTEIMKRLADEQKLFLIIADSDYIYGTNYQFCHGYLSKDLDLTQEKIIQALGRIGRNNIQQEYSARFRDDEHVKMLFRKTPSEAKPEVINMNLLFNSRTVKWDLITSTYKYLEEECDSYEECSESQEF